MKKLCKDDDMIKDQLLSVSKRIILVSSGEHLAKTNLSVIAHRSWVGYTLTFYLEVGNLS